MDKLKLSPPLAATSAGLGDGAGTALPAAVDRAPQSSRMVEAPDGSSTAELLLQANEQLVLAVLDAQTVAESAIGDLNAIARTSQHDPLTNLPNRALVLDRLQNAVTLAHRRGVHLAVLFLDLDKFKHINDELGHRIGDEVLQTVASRLTSVIRESDTVGRYGGDEFLVVLPEVSQPSDAALIALKILSHLATPIHSSDRTFDISASIGIAMYPKNGEDTNSLIAHADAAMYRSKRSGPGGFQFYTHEEVSDSSGTPHRDDAAKWLAQRGHQVHRRPDPELPQLREVNEQLLMGALAAQTLKTDAEEAHQRQVQFLGMLAHELRNPLAPLLSAAYLLRSQVLLPPVVQHLGEIMERQVQHLTRLVDDLLDVSRITSGELSLIGGPQGEHADIRVRDSGVEMDAALLPRVFDPFVQADPSLDHPHGGPAIGLTVVKAMVELHGGTVEVVSTGRGCGSEFIVRLPRAADVQSLAPTPPPDAPADAGQIRRVLIVDDNIDGLEILSMMCRRWGHEVCSACNGLTALQLVASFKPDLVLLDIGLPGMDGYEVARCIRADKVGKDIVLIALTGYGETDDRRKALEAGFDDHLTKPVPLIALKKLIAALTDRK